MLGEKIQNTILFILLVLLERMPLPDMIYIYYGSEMGTGEGFAEDLGKFLTENTDYVIFTTDNPRYENEEEIINDLTTNLTKDNFQKITNRKEAIKTGIGLLENEDVLLILGKGHEDYQIFGSDEFPFKDRDEVLKNIK